MDPINSVYNKDERLLRKIYDLINQPLDNKNNLANMYYIQSDSYKNIKEHFNPINRYKEKARKIIKIDPK